VDLCTDDEEDSSDNEEEESEVEVVGIIKKEKQEKEVKAVIKKEKQEQEEDSKVEVVGLEKEQEQDQHHENDDKGGDNDEGTGVEETDIGVIDNHVYYIDSGVEDGEECEEEAECTMCHECGGTPCDWLQYESDVVEFATNSLMLVDHKTEGFPFSYPTENFEKMTKEEKDEVKVSHQDYKKRCFQYYVSCKYGKLGPRKRVYLGPCVENAIRRMFPNHDGSMVGYHSS
jgi:hypothetical protein